MKITTNYLRQVIKEELEAVLAEEEKSPEWQKAYKEKYNDITKILFDPKIKTSEYSNYFTEEELNSYRSHLNDRRDEPYGGSGDDDTAKVAFAKETATKYANNNS